mgnify:CR=1 FL=1
MLFRSRLEPTRERRRSASYTSATRITAFGENQEAGYGGTSLISRRRKSLSQLEEQASHVDVERLGVRRRAGPLATARTVDPIARA